MYAYIIAYLLAVQTNQTQIEQKYITPTNVRKTSQTIVIHYQRDHYSGLEPKAELFLSNANCNNHQTNSRPSSKNDNQTVANSHRTTESIDMFLQKFKNAQPIPSSTLFYSASPSPHVYKQPTNTHHPYLTTHNQQNID